MRNSFDFAEKYHIILLNLLLQCFRLRIVKFPDMFEILPPFVSDKVSNSTLMSVQVVLGQTLNTSYFIKI